MNDISFESPNTELPDSETKTSVASSGRLPHPSGVRLSFKGNYLLRNYGMLTTLKSQDRIKSLPEGSNISSTIVVE